MNNLLNIFSKKIGPVFLKETSDTADFIEKMEKLAESADGQLKEDIQKQIKLAKHGQYGESNIAYELKNSGMDMYILHDIYLETGELSAQIDYIVITRKLMYILECKNLIGNIEINNTGTFIRTFELDGKKIVKSIYSPISQNQKHMQVLKQIRSESKKNFIAKKLFESSFENNYKSLVVLANPETLLNAKFAKKEVKEQVIRADQLIDTIKKMEAQVKDSMSADEMKALAEFYLANNQPKKSDYAKRYEEAVAAFEKQEEVTNYDISDQQKIDNEGLVKRLKEFRMQQSAKEKIKPYMVFTDAQMNDLIDKNPKDKDELLMVSGFGAVKVEKYGENILEILKGDSSQV